MTNIDRQLKLAIETELRWDPAVNAARIGVRVDGGAVTLVGSVDTFAERWAAERAARRVGAVRTLTQELTVEILEEHMRGDWEIAAAVHTALRWNVFVPKTVTAVVERGVVTLEGEVHWNFQREAAALTIRFLPGVVAVHDHVAMQSHSVADPMKGQVEAALERQAATESHAIHVETHGSRVTLTGEVSSWPAVQNALHAAWAAPGVTEVVDNVTISTNR